jgi:hypothetical protein
MRPLMWREPLLDVGGVRVRSEEGEEWSIRGKCEVVDEELQGTTERGSSLSD